MTRIPVCTYRLQFNRQFTFAQAREIVSYLDALGISDCYASPYFQARAESLHGYDITDHNKLNAAIGSRADYDAWIADLRAHGMGQIVDFVPNHMGVGEPLNHWWMDVLENGPSSMYAPWFDIEWKPLKSDLQDKVLLPILGDQYGRVLERGELQVRFEAGAFYLRYYEHEFPIAPGTYRHILQVALDKLEPFKSEDYYAEFQSIITALEYLPRRTETNPERIAERTREKEIIKRRLERRCQEAPQVQAAVLQAVEQINGTPGDPRSFDALDSLLNDQSYRLAFWRVAAEEINYRRFFDVNDLAAIRMELPEVFDATHRLLLELVATGAVTGVRVDHPDGLYLPREYFEKLQRRSAAALGAPLPPDGRAIYLVVEKILSGNETLRSDWSVHGTTGYEFGKLVANVLVDGSAEQAITKTFQRFIGHSMHFGHLVYAKKRLVMRLSLANDVNVLGDMLDRLSEKNRWFRDFTLDALARAVRETIACFPVYRTYVEPGQPVSEEDRAVIERAVTTAKRRNPALEDSVFNFLRDILLFRFPENLDDEARKEHAHFVLKFQQSTGPIMAKGLEDTAFYVYNRLAALNEVGGEPQHFGIGLDEFHQRNFERQRDWPSSLLATSTHDTKRSEDVRARMVAISEVPQLWRSSLQRWRVINRRWKRNLDEASAPDANEEYLFYQTLVGTWPMDAAGRAEPAATAEYIERVQTYMAKALKEAKINTSWIQPNEQWDAAMSEFVARVLDSSTKNKFIPAFLPVAEEIARLGAINSLSQVALKLTAPGVPDIYQGNEIWDFSLVDPDNRRPVDYARRGEMLRSLDTAAPAELLQQCADGRIKLFLTQRLLRFRREHSQLFEHGSYVPLNVTGTFAENCVAFAREHEGNWIAIVVPRLSSRVGFPPIGEAWQDTAVDLPASLSREGARELFTGCKLNVDDNAVRLSDAMAVLPFAVYTNAL
ncbi:MAG: malto-oligosyltrehalose synthase [Verrucomicrobia bacterium]|nr:MAG: malto-oligosyltrehalose synthase [Verrucomicrobiota bacterium]